MPRSKIIQLFIDSYSGISREIWLLSIVTLVNRAGAMVLPFLSLYLTVEEGYSLSTTGSILLFFGIGSFFGNYFGGILTDKIGAFRIQLLSLVTTGLAFFGLSYLHSPLSFSIGLFATSLLADAFRPANMASVAVIESEEKRTKAVGVIRLAINIGFAAGPAFGGLIAYSNGYKWLFAIDGMTCLLAAIFLFIFFRAHLKKEGKRDVSSSEEEKPSIRMVLKDYSFLYLLFLVFLIGVVFIQVFNAVPVFYKENLFIDENWIGLLMALNGVLIVVLEVPIIHIYEQKSKLSLITLGSILLGISYLALLYDQWAGIAIISMTILTIGEILTLPFVTTVIINRASDSLRGRYLALYGMTFSMCHIAAPVLGMQVADKFGFSTLWELVGIFALLSGIGFWMLKKSME